MMNTVAFHTLGCKVNFSETSTISRQFAERGYRIVDAEEPCNVYVLNTCSVTGRADKECRQVIRRALRHSPDAYVVVIGCYAQLQPEEIASIEGVDLVLGAKEKFNIFSHAGTFTKGQRTQVFVSCIDEPLEFIDSSSGETDGRTRAYLKVQDGCDYTCSFCTIPLARGASRSQSIENIVQQAHALAIQGYNEIVLTGVNVGDYGKSIGSSFLELVKALDDVPVDRFRVSSIEPNLLTNEIVDFILSSKHFCNHFHIPLQSGSDTVLKKMRRRYRTEQYRNLVEYIKRKDPDACIGADVLVGFPGETDALFEETQLFLSELAVSYLHVFTYSERAQTPAAEYSDSVPMHVRSERNEELRILGQKKRSAFYRQFEGSVLPVLFESATPISADAGAGTHEREYSGWTRNYVRVAVPSMEALTNCISLVHLADTLHNERCSGELVLHASDNSADLVPEPGAAFRIVQSETLS